MNKGFANILLIIGVAIATLAGSIFYTNHEKQNINSSLNKLGATIATTSLSDTIGTFRTNINSSLENINTQLGSVSSTISAFGNIVAENTPLAVNKGGTGTSTTPSDTQYLMSSGTIPTWKYLVGGAGITVSSTPTSTILNTAGFDNTANISFTGQITFSSSTVHNGSSTFNATTTFNRAVVFNASTTGGAYIPILASATVTSTKSFSLTSATFTVVGTSTANGMASSTITLIGTHRVLLTFSGAYLNSGTDVNSLTFTVDGVDVAAGNYGVAQYQASGANVTGNLSTTFITNPLPAGSHTFRALVRTDTGTITVGINNTGNYQWAFQVAELYN